MSMPMAMCIRMSTSVYAFHLANFATAGGKDTISETFSHESFIRQQHLQIVSVPKILKHFSRILDRQLNDGRLGKNVLVYRSI